MSDVSQPSPSMTVDEFLVWAEDRPGRYELAGGQVFAMSPERIRHTSTKFSVSLALHHAIQSAEMTCQVLPDGATVHVDRTTAYQPDALVRCGSPLSGGATEVPDRMIAVEVLSPSTRNYDAGAKLAGYFAVSSIRHYLMVDPDRRVVVHHRRDGDAIATRVTGAGTLRLDPPGLDIAIDDLFGGE